jgi:hypothetical protein
VDPLLAAALFRGIKPSYSCALIWRLHAVEFPCGHTVFAEENPVTSPSSLLRHYSGKVNYWPLRHRNLCAQIACAF